MNKHLIWVVGLVLIVAMIMLTILYLNQNPFIFRIEMDNNTLEATKKISEIKSIECNYPLDCPQSVNNSVENNCVYLIQCREEQGK